MPLPFRLLVRTRRACFSEVLDTSYSMFAVLVCLIIPAAFLHQVHISASECLLEMSKLYRDTPTHKEEIEFLDELVDLCQVEKSEQAKTYLRQCITILEDLRQRSSAMMCNTSI